MAVITGGEIRDHLLQGMPLIKRVALPFVILVPVVVKIGQRRDDGQLEEGTYIFPDDLVELAGEECFMLTYVPELAVKQK